MSSSSSYYYSASSTATDGTTSTGHRYTTSEETDPEGNTTVRTAHQDLGEPAMFEEYRYDSTGQEFLTSSSSAGGVKTITDEDEERVWK